jgi:hypothetical protein
VDRFFSQFGDRIQYLSRPVYQVNSGYYRRISTISAVFHMSRDFSIIEDVRYEVGDVYEAKRGSGIERKGWGTNVVSCI